MRQASLIIIGDEILSGRTEDKNLAYLANWLGKIGINLSEVRVISVSYTHLTLPTNREV